MQVQRISTNNTNFGFNPEVNSQLMNTLMKAKKNKAYYQYLLNLCGSTNFAELELRKAEAQDKPYLYSLLVAAFVPAKIFVTNLINNHFPNLDYRNKEIASYMEEAQERELEQKDPSHWINGIVNSLREQEMQDQASNVTAVLEDVMKEIFPALNFDFSGLKGAVKQKLSSADEPEEDEGSTGARLEESIELGKEKVVEYIPTESAQKGFAALGGMEELKKTLNERIVGVLKDPAQAKLDAVEYGKKIPKGLLLYGPPGCGKTTVVEHLSTEAGVPLLKLESGSLKSSYYHETSKNIDAAFDYAESIATPEKPVLLMIDDADSFFTKRKQSTDQFEAEELTTFLNRIQRASEHNVMVAATTNRFDIMDEAVKSRFDEQIYVGLPDLEARKSIIKLFMNQRVKGKALANDDKAITEVAEKFESFPIRAIKMLSDKASLEALSDGRRDILASDFNKVIAQNQDMKIKENNYKSNNTRVPIGFNNGITVSSKGPQALGHVSEWAGL